MSASLWYKDAVIYQLRVRSFYDSDGDGIGDLRGLTEKLDYLQDLGVTALWLLPFYPSPLRDDGYDIADYTAVDPQCGTLRDFRAFLKAAHRRSLRVITELVLNHTSDQHPWFQRARRSPPGSRWRDFYVWNDTPDRYREARIIFKDFEHSNWAWDPVAKSYYWHRFYAHQPDLNFDNAEVQRAMKGVLDFWLEMGVDGLRLDAVPYLYEREGTSCENLPETHAFLRELRAHVDRRFEDRMLLAEANQWPEDAVAYFGKGDECHMAFHFPIMPRLFMGIHMEDRYPILDILEQTPAIPDNAQWAIFLRNHDELTLEMVTDEERDYMWRVYARDGRARINLGIRRRLAPLLENNRRRIELMNALLLALPGTPVIYYGDEIGMGDNVYLGDRNGVRTPMQWSPDRNAGFSRANPQRLILPVVMDPEYHCEAVNVEVQQGNQSSLLWWTKRTLALRRQFHAFGSGSFEPLDPANRKVLAFLRRHGEERLLVVANLSRFPQYVELDLREFKGSIPVELYGRVEFPTVTEQPMVLTLGPHAFYWFSLEGPRALAASSGPVELPRLEVRGRWHGIFEETGRGGVERAISAWLPARRWFRSKARRLRGVRLLDAVPLDDERATRLVFVRAEYAEGEAEIYVVPLAFRPGAPPEAALARVRIELEGGPLDGALVEATDDETVANALLEVAMRRRRVRGESVEIQGHTTPLLRRIGRESDERSLTPRLGGAEQSNTSWMFGSRLVGKLLRRLDEGVNPDLEVVRHLTEARFPHVPAHAGHLDVRVERGGTATLALFQSFVPNEGDAWRFTLDEIDRGFDLVLAQQAPVTSPPDPPADLLVAARSGVEPDALGPFATYLDLAALLGRRTAELHRALGSADAGSDFAAEAFTPFSRRSAYQSFRNLAVRVLDTLREHATTLPEEARALAARVLAQEEEIFARFRRITERPIGGKLIRCHGDFHLGQVLWTGRDFVILDFEGEPARSLGERRRKRSPLVDVAGMLRSFHYAGQSALLAVRRPEDLPVLDPWARRWAEWTCARFLGSYLAESHDDGLLPGPDDELALLLDVHMLEKALYEVGYELNNRPDWVAIPLRGIEAVLAPASHA